MADIEMTQGNRLPSLYCQLHDYTGVLDLSGVASVRWVMMDQTGASKVDAAASVVTPASFGIVRYDWASGDTDTPGTFFGQFELTIGGKTQNVPSDRHLSVAVLEHPR